MIFHHKGIVRSGIGLALVGMLVLLTVSTTFAAAPANSHFLRTWERPDKPVADGMISRTWMWGPSANTPAMNEPYIESPGGSRTVQYFDKSRMEITNPNSDPNSIWYVTNGLLVMELVTGKLQLGDNAFQQLTPANVNVAGDANDPTGPTYETFGKLRSLPALPNGSPMVQRVDQAANVTSDPALAGYGVNAAYRVVVPGIDHQVASPFWSFMNASGLVYQGGYTNDSLFQDPFYATGLPITEAYWATVKVGGIYKDVLTQCFERRCLTYTPGNSAGWQVEAGNVGQHYYQWRYGQNQNPPPAPPQPPASQHETLVVRTAPSGPYVTTTSNSWAPVPDMNAAVTLTSTADLAMTVSAEASTSGSSRMGVRALLDGQPANPSDVIFVTGGPYATHAFTFSAVNVSPGQHTVQIQWLVDPGGTAFIGDRTLTVAATPEISQNGMLFVRSAQSGPDMTTTSQSWLPLPDMAAGIITDTAGDLAISLSAEARTSNGAFMFVRVLVDGQPAGLQQVVLTADGSTDVHAFTFTRSNLAAGVHTIQVQWKVDSIGETAFAGDRTLTVQSSPPAAGQGALVAKTAPKQWISTTSAGWDVIADLDSTINTPANGTLAITFSAEATATPGARVFVRVLVDGQAISPSDVLLATDGPIGAHAFTFTVENLSAGSHTIQLQWGTDAGGTAHIFGHSMIAASS